ncbi:hypothetical protein BVX94_01835 [bacterium B17]|nr:hypothetical protein BVX94_01835 [bacterium B17]
MTQSTANKILSRIYGKGRGWCFTPSHFLDLSSRKTAIETLRRLTNRGTIRRLAQGLYDYPQKHQKLGLLSPNPENIAQALAGRDSTRILPSGAYAANILGLSEQVPAKIIFLTDGPARKIKIGNQEIILKKTTSRNMALADKISGLIIQSLRHIGQKQITDEHIASLTKTLTAKDKKRLKLDAKYAPAWLYPIIKKITDDK